MLHSLEVSRLLSGVANLSGLTGSESGVADAFHTVTNDCTMAILPPTACRLFEPATRNTTSSSDVRFVDDEFPLATAALATASSLLQSTPAQCILITLHAKLGS